MYNWSSRPAKKSKSEKNFPDWNNLYVNSVWMCNECAEVQKKESKNHQLESMVGVASPANVYPNAPKADESGL